MNQLCNLLNSYCRELAKVQTRHAVGRWQKEKENCPLVTYITKRETLLKVKLVRLRRKQLIELTTRHMTQPLSGDDSD